MFFQIILDFRDELHPIFFQIAEQTIEFIARNFNRDLTILRLIPNDFITRRLEFTIIRLFYKLYFVFFLFAVSDLFENCNIGDMSG